MENLLRHLDEIHLIKLTKEKDGYKAIIGDAEYKVSDLFVQENFICFRIDGELRAIYHAQDSGTIYMALAGEHYLVETVKARESGAKSTVSQEESSIASQMPGLLVKLPVAVGDKVKAGETLAIVEAMKMQNELRAPRDGTVQKINFREGEQVDAFQVIVELADPHKKTVNADSLH
jgi:3-methylcrotonyl-CoA carboxylase alpha subunit